MRLMYVGTYVLMVISFCLCKHYNIIYNHVYKTQYIKIFVIETLATYGLQTTAMLIFKHNNFKTPWLEYGNHTRI